MADMFLVSVIAVVAVLGITAIGLLIVLIEGYRWGRKNAQGGWND